MSEQLDLASLTPDEIEKHFTYRLNAMEVAGRAEQPFKAGYGEKRKAVFDFVRQLAERSGR